MTKNKTPEAKEPTESELLLHHLAAHVKVTAEELHENIYRHKYGKPVTKTRYLRLQKTMNQRLLQGVIIMANLSRSVDKGQ